jgi:hypothetical protein
VNNANIITFAETIHYAAFAVSNANTAFTMHYGKQSWHRQLRELTQEQREALMAEIGRWEAMKEQRCLVDK